MAKWGEINCPRCAELEGKLAQQDSLWEAFKDRWTGERKYALRIIVKYLKGQEDE